uniref:DIS3-like exonuclease 2 n=1 Tax=Pristionchus pacificus TaxID=54126 RepID=A0A8R1Z4K2_PRIPA
MTDEVVVAEPPKEKKDKTHPGPPAPKIFADEVADKKVKGRVKAKAVKTVATADEQSSSKSEGTNKDSKPSTAEKSDDSDVISKKKKRVPRKKNSKNPEGSVSEEKSAESGKVNGSVKDGEDKKINKASKRRERAKKKASQTMSSSTSKSLSAEGLALLQDISAKAEARRNKNGIKTGKISMTELMGDGCIPADLQRLRLTNVSPESLLKTAFANMPQVPGFPSLTHRPDPGPFSNSFRPELFKTTMEAYATAATLNCSENDGGFGREIPSRSGRYSPDQILPWVSFAPMYPIDQSRGRANSSSSTIFKGPTNNGPGGFRSPTGPGFSRPPFNPNNNYQRGSMSPHQSFIHQGQSRPSFSSTSHSNSNQKTRKPFFMPYLSHDAVARGLSAGELIKGSLRVNQRNYEESYVDNPEGDDQADLLILGVHDRNRALQSDVVVVRIKSRENWVVRDGLYNAWRQGKLKMSKDDDGKPMSIPPIPPTEQPAHLEMLNGLVHAGDVSASELSKTVPQCDEKVYDRKAMLLIAAQNEESVACASIEGEHSCDDLKKEMEGLGISKLPEVAKAPVARSPQAQRKNRSQQSGQNRRNNIKLLNEMPDEDWGMPDICLQKTAEVVYIAEQKNCRAAMGQLKVMADGNRNWALFSPTDSRMPRMLIPCDQLPIGFFERPHDYQRFIFVARMEDWQATAQFARGKLERTLGEAGDIDAETEGLLIENSIDTREFSHAVLSCLPISESSQWQIDEKEFKYRRDLRETTIFTIDPMTARDLDDALSIDPCDDIDGKGTPGWEIGVHIADVAHFVMEGNELDSWASHRATSVYLVHKVVPMLPRILCEELCSLNPGVDRLSFSVIWKMDREGNVKDEWFGRTIIKSCVKLSYEHAQDMIEQPDKDFTADELPKITNGRLPADVKSKVLSLHEVATHLRKRREANGSLRLDQPKLKFALDDDTKLPFGVTIYERKDSNSLVEEFMLLANMSVAKRIEDSFPTISVLRNHPPPKEKVMREVLELCEKIGFPLDASSSGLLSSSLRKFEGNQIVQTAVNQVLSSFMMKPMQLAKYFCTGTVKSKDAYHHYALNVPFYTHFTSPIRRYPDVMVHRLLAAACGYAPAPTLSPNEIQAIADHCNFKKTTAKTVSDKSSETFFGLFVKQAGPLVEKAVVINVLDQSFDVLVLKYGVVTRVYVNRLDMARDPQFVETPSPSLTLFWNPSCGKPGAGIEQRIQICSIVDVVLSALPEPTKYMTVVKMCPANEAKTLHDLTEIL